MQSLISTFWSFAITASTSGFKKTIYSTVKNTIKVISNAREFSHFTGSWSNYLKIVF